MKKTIGSLLIIIAIINMIVALATYGNNPDDAVPKIIVGIIGGLIGFFLVRSSNK